VGVAAGVCVGCAEGVCAITVTAATGPFAAPHALKAHAANTSAANRTTAASFFNLPFLIDNINIGAILTHYQKNVLNKP
jgi:hypothetical protein